MCVCVHVRVYTYMYQNVLVEILFSVIVYVYMHMSKKLKLATIVGGEPKATFSIATIPRCRGGHYSFPGLLHFTLTL